MEPESDLQGVRTGVNMKTESRNPTTCALSSIRGGNVSNQSVVRSGEESNLRPVPINNPYVNAQQQ